MGEISGGGGGVQGGWRGVHIPQNYTFICIFITCIETTTRPSAGKWMGGVEGDIGKGTVGGGGGEGRGGGSVSA